MRARLRRLPPRGWGDFGLQLVIWLGFGLAYQLARGFADRGPLEAFENGRAVIGVALLWIYFCRNDAFTRVRNWVLATNTLALVGYVFMPTAPPRLFPEEGFVDTLAVSAALNHGSGLVELASNPFAAMPSVHAADALIIGFAMAMLVKSRWLRTAWTLWPSWVWFSVVATGNHFWLDIAAGVGLALVAGTMLAWVEGRRLEDLSAPVSASDTR